MWVFSVSITVNIDVDVTVEELGGWGEIVCSTYILEDLKVGK